MLCYTFVGWGSTALCRWLTEATCESTTSFLVPETVTGTLDFALGNESVSRLLCTANMWHIALIHAFVVVASLWQTMTYWMLYIFQILNLKRRDERVKVLATGAEMQREQMTILFYSHFPTAGLPIELRPHVWLLLHQSIASNVL